MKNILLFLFIFLAASVAAQSPCRECQCLIDKADEAIQAKDFRTAIEKLNAAKACDDTQQSLIGQKILNVFELIEKQRDEARRNEQVAQAALAKTETLIGYFGFSQNRAWAYKDGKFALINRDGKRLTGFDYEEPRPFTESGYAIARKGGFYHLISLAGKDSDPYVYILPANNGWYKVQKEGKYTFIDQQLRLISGLGWCEEIDTFLDGRARIRKGDKWGFLNVDGSVIEPWYEEISQFEDGLAVVKKNGKFGLISTDGQIRQPPAYDRLNYLGEGIYWIGIQGKWTYIDTSGQLVIPARYNWIGDFSGGLAKINIGGRVNASTLPYLTGSIGETSIFGQSYSTGKEYEDNTNVSGGKWGYIDTRGHVVVSPQFDDAMNFSGGLAIVKMNEKWGLIDSTGKIVVPVEYADIDTVSLGFIKVKKEGKWGMLDKKGKVRIPVNFDEIELMSNGLAKVNLGGEANLLSLYKQGGKWGCVDTNGPISLS